MTCRLGTCGAYNCNPSNTACLTTCTADIDCFGNNTCNGGVCSQTNRCNVNICGAYKCDPNGPTCLKICKADSDCTGDNTCQGGACFKQRPWTAMDILKLVGIIIFALIILGLSIYFAVKDHQRMRNYEISHPGAAEFRNYINYGRSDHGYNSHSIF